MSHWCFSRFPPDSSPRDPHSGERVEYVDSCSFHSPGIVVVDSGLRVPPDLGRMFVAVLGKGGDQGSPTLTNLH